VPNNYEIAITSNLTDNAFVKEAWFEHPGAGGTGIYVALTDQPGPTLMGPPEGGDQKKGGPIQARLHKFDGSVVAEIRYWYSNAGMVPNGPYNGRYFVNFLDKDGVQLAQFDCGSLPGTYNGTTYWQVASDSHPPLTEGHSIGRMILSGGVTGVFAAAKSAQFFMPSSDWTPARGPSTPSTRPHDPGPK
jgi:hypothetical protein